MLTFALVVLGLVSKPEHVGLGFAVDYLPAVLKSVGEAARINYAGICPGQDKVLLPRVYAQPAPQGSTGIIAVRQIFQDDPQVTVTQDQSGMLRITIGSVPTSALQTRIPTLTLDSASQFTQGAAEFAIAGALRTYAAEHALHLGMASTTIDVIVSAPREGAPHLPPLMQDVTVDDALDSVARTFGGIVLYGTCVQPDGKELFRID